MCHYVVIVCVDGVKNVKTKLTNIINLRRFDFLKVTGKSVSMIFSELQTSLFEA